MDREIIRGCRNWDRESQKRLYRTFYSYGMSITLRYTNSREQAAEVLNDAFMKVFTKFNSYDSNRPFKPWLRRIIINTAINHYHSTEKYRETESLEPIEHVIGHDQQIISGITYDEIIELVQKLTPAYRTVFNLYVIEGFKHREIADMLDISIGTSKSNLSKAKRNLQALLEENFI